MRRAWLVVLVLALAGAVTLVLNRGSDEPGKVQRFRVDGQKSLLLLPTHRSNGHLVIYLHGAGENAESVLGARHSKLTARLRSDGYALAASDSYDRNWGNPASVELQTDLQREATKRTHVTGTVLLAASMGGLDAFLSAPHLQHVQAIVGLYPVADVDSVARLGVFDHEITNAYASDPSARPSRSPVALTGSFWKGLHVELFASDGDTTVPKTSNADVYAKEARQAGAVVQFIRTQGDHGDPSNFQPARTAAFLDAAIAERPISSSMSGIPRG